ncbi:MAG: phenylalanine--tRNA ligase subunit beta [Candidatus Hadarchaeota archaeon]
MPIITASYRDLCRLLGRKIEVEKLCERLSMVGMETEAEGYSLKMEVFHNRPDLLSPEGVARALKGFLGIETGLPRYRLSGPRVVVDVDASVAQVRPFIAAGVVRDVQLTDDIVASLMQIQEKLHASLCRNRRRASIGVYDMDKVAPPIKYTTVAPDGIKFTPLDFGHECTPAQILMEHPKGLEYSWLLKDMPRYPLLVDSKGVVLSMPPIINSEDTRVTSGTKNLFIDVTGLDERAVEQPLAILMTALAERGFKIEQVAVRRRKAITKTPDLNPRKHKLSIRQANRTIGLNLASKEIARVAKRMRYGVGGAKGDSVTLLAPPYRTDIMHEIDLIEDIAVGYGYDRLEPTYPKVLTIGEKAEVEKTSSEARQVLTGLGFTEVMNYILTNPRSEMELMKVKEEVAEIANPVSEEYTILRASLIPSLLGSLHQNRRNPLPQRIFEVGDVVVLDPSAETGAANVRRAAGAIIGGGAGFTEIKGIAEALLRELGVKCDVKAAWSASFLDGRAVEFYSEGKKIGVAGEIHPEVLVEFELEHPAAVFEVDLE